MGVLCVALFVYSLPLTLLHQSPDAEVYNEKIYDLLSSPASTPSIASSTHSSTPTSVLQAGLGFLSVKAKGGFFKSFQTVKRNALTLKADKVGAGGMGKYVAGMREVRVHNAQVGPLFYLSSVGT